MIEGGQGLRFAVEPGEPFRIVRHGLGQDLDGDVAAEIRVASPVDLAHAAHADLDGDLVWAEAMPVASAMWELA